MNSVQIYNDESLYGHTLLCFPEKVRSFSQNPFCLYPPPDPGTLIIERDYGIARSVRYESSTENGMRIIGRTELCIEKPLCDLVEFVGRRILGSCAMVLAYLIATPLGFTAKVIHLSVREISNFIEETTFAQKMSQIWNDPSLFGHALTKAPSDCYKIATAPLDWHLRADGTDRRSYIAKFDPVSGTTVHQSEYQLVPFELFESIFRRGICGAATVVLSIASPLGLLAKSIHLFTYSCLRES